MTLMTFKIPDIACIGHLFNLLMYYVRGFACAWMAPRARNLSSSGLATFNPQSTVHGPRPGPKLACGVRASSLRATKPRSRGKTRGPKRKKCRRAEKHMYIYMYTYQLYHVYLVRAYFCPKGHLLCTWQCVENNNVYMIRAIWCDNNHFNIT